MSYAPQNKTTFTAAYAGALAGIGASQKTPTDVVSTDPAVVSIADVSGSFAQSFDAAWGAVVPSELDVLSIEQVSTAYFMGSAPPNVPPFNAPSNWTAVCQALIALVKAGDAYFASQGITPDPWAGGAAPALSSSGFQALANQAAPAAFNGFLACAFPYTPKSSGSVLIGFAMSVETSEVDFIQATIIVHQGSVIAGGTTLGGITYAEGSPVTVTGGTSTIQGFGGSSSGAGIASQSNPTLSVIAELTPGQTYQIVVYVDASGVGDNLTNLFASVYAKELD